MRLRPAAAAEVQRGRRGESALPLRGPAAPRYLLSPLSWTMPPALYRPMLMVPSRHRASFVLSRVPVEPSDRSSGRPRVRAAHPLISLHRRGSPAGMASTQVSVPASWYFRMAACRALIPVLARTTPGRSGATLDSNDQHYPDHRRVRGCHSYRSPGSAGRPAHAGTGRWSRCSAWTLEIPTSSVRSNCSAGHGGLAVPGHPHERVTERGGEWCTCLAPPVGRYASFHAE